MDLFLYAHGQRTYHILTARREENLKALKEKS